jgi:hypothetical protein
MSPIQDTKETLIELLAPCKKLDPRTVHTFAITLIGLVRVASVTLSQIALSVDKDIKTDSKYKRIQRFVHHFKPDFRFYVQTVFDHFAPKQKGKSVVLAIDRTNWKFGKHNLNFLVVALCFYSVAIPLVWKLLPHRGCSDVDSQKALLRLLRRSLKPCQFKQIQTLTTDREFGSKELIRYLQAEGINPVIRLKKNLIVEDTNKKLYHFFRRNRPKYLRKPIKVLGVSGYVSGYYLPCKQKREDDYVLIFSLERNRQALKLYEQRWRIETMFGAFIGCESADSRGFNLESTHITHPSRLKSLLFLVSIAFCWMVLAGDYLVKDTPIPQRVFKQEREGVTQIQRRNTISRFTLVFDAIRAALFNAWSIRHFLILLSCT